jgi:hypothetical protein
MAISQGGPLPDPAGSEKGKQQDREYGKFNVET